MRKGYVIIRNVIEEVNLVFRQGDCSTDGMDWSITPTFVEETAVSVKGIEELGVCRSSKPLQATDLKI